LLGGVVTVILSYSPTGVIVLAVIAWVAFALLGDR